MCVALTGATERALALVPRSAHEPNACPRDHEAIHWRVGHDASRLCSECWPGIEPKPRPTARRCPRGCPSTAARCFLRISARSRSPMLRCRRPRCSRLRRLQSQRRCRRRRSTCLERIRANLWPVDGQTDSGYLPEKGYDSSNSGGGVPPNPFSHVCDRDRVAIILDCANRSIYPHTSTFRRMRRWLVGSYGSPRSVRTYRGTQVGLIERGNGPYLERAEHPSMEASRLDDSADLILDGGVL